MEVLNSGRTKTATMLTNRTYQELKQFSTFETRFRYLKLDGRVGIVTFGYDRYLNQAIYTSRQWQDVRRNVIIRDNGCDLGILDRPLAGRIYIHHMNPLTPEDLRTQSGNVFNEDNLICTSQETHEAIHYGDMTRVLRTVVERQANDTLLWQKGVK
jgi:hypothetical protein